MILGKVQSGQPRVENDKSGVVAGIRKALPATVNPINPELSLMKSLLEVRFIWQFFIDDKKIIRQKQEHSHSSP